MSSLFPPTCGDCGGCSREKNPPSVVAETKPSTTPDVVTSTQSSGDVQPAAAEVRAKHVENTREICPVCLEGFCDKVKFPCNHVFCYLCAKVIFVGGFYHR